jgi:hypothetical protein
MDFFDVYVLRFDVNEERATRALMQVFGLSEAAARIFVHSVPRVGKRDVPTHTAERYVRALHAVGAIVECRRSGAAPLGESANNIQHMSLPVPANSSYPGASTPPTIMQDSLGIMAPLAYSPDMPQIPKAPRLPADLHHIRARKGPDSLAPNWRPSDRRASMSSGASSQAGHAEMGSGGGTTVSSDEAIWSAGAIAAGAAASHALSSDPMASPLAPVGDSLESPKSEANAAPSGREPSGPLDLDSPLPLSPSPFTASGPANLSSEPSPWYATATHQLLLAALIIGGMAVALSSGVFETDAHRQTRAFELAGIDAGAYEPAERFLNRSGSRFDALPQEQLQALVDRLERAGARGVWVGDIQQQGSRRSSRTLLLDLPNDETQRHNVFDELASTRRAGQQVANDTGQRYVRVDF